MGILLYNNYFRKHDLIQRTHKSLILSVVYLLPITGLWMIFSLLLIGLMALVGPLLIPEAGQALTGLAYFYLSVGFARLILCRAANQDHVGAFSQVISGISPLIGGVFLGVLMAGFCGGGLFLLMKFAPPVLVKSGYGLLIVLMLPIFYCGLFFLADNETAGPLEAVAGTFSLLFKHLVKWVLWLAVYILFIVAAVGTVAGLLWLADLVAANPLGFTDRETITNIADMFKALQTGDFYAVLALSTVEWVVFLLLVVLYYFIYIFGQMSFAVTYAQAVYYKPEALTQQMTLADFHH